MNKKRFRKRALAVAATAVMAGSLAGCGNADSSKQAVADKQTESRTETSVTDMAGPVVDAMTSDLAAEVTDEAVAEEEAVVEEAAETVAEASEPVSENTNSGDSASIEAKAENTKTIENRSSGSNSVPSTKAKSSNSEANASSGSNDSNSSGSGNSVPSTQTPHTHNWKEHTATQQVWVSNMVTVDDYEERTVDNGYYECDCGATFPLNDAGRSALYEHGETNMLEQVRAGKPVTCGGSLIYHDYQIERVKVGSHQEDQGHYETQTYVDYYYCDCGARK